MDMLSFKFDNATIALWNEEETQHSWTSSNADIVSINSQPRVVFEGPVQSSLFAFLGKTRTRTGPSGPWNIFGPVKTGLSKDQS
jgi:hypothetical protein